MGLLIHWFFPTEMAGLIDVVLAGNQQRGNYYELINQFDWQQFYQELDGKAYIEFLKNGLKQSDYDYVFIDSRTGVNDYSGICNIQFPDINVLVVAPSEQNMLGSSEIAKKIAQSPYKKALGNAKIVPILSRLDTSDSDGYSQRFTSFESTFEDQIGDLFTELRGTRIAFNGSSEFIEKTFLQYSIDVSYQEINLFQRGKKKFSPGSLEDKIENIAIVIEALSKREIQQEKSFIRKIPRELTFLPPPPETWIRREPIIEELAAEVERCKKALLINGLGGIGKTALVRQYVHTYKSQFNHIAWINIFSPVEVERDKGNKAVEAFANNQSLFENLRIPFDSQQSTRQRLRQILNELKSLPGQNLLVIDNASEDILEFQKELPQPPEWKVIITSREQLSPFVAYHLDQLSPEQAEDLFFHYYTKSPKQEEAVRELLGLIGYNTLMIELLARLCQSSIRYKPEDVLESLKTNQLNQLNREVWTEHSDRQVQVYGYLLSAFSLTELDKAEKLLLLQFSVLPSKEIHFDYIIQLFQIGEQEEEQTEKALLNLVKKGWLEYNQDKAGFRCHPMIQEITRYQLSPNTKNCDALIRGLTDLIHVDPTTDNPVDKFKWIEFGDTFLSFIKDTSVNLLTLKTELALLHRDLGNYDRAKKLLEEVTLASNTDLRNLVLRKSLLAEVYRYLGKYDKAEKGLEEALQLAATQFDRHGPEFLSIRINLALVQNDLGKYEEAHKNLEDTVSQFMKFYGQNPSAFSTIRFNLSQVYINWGENEIAKDLLQILLSIDKVNWGPDHIYTAKTHSNIGVTYNFLGQYDNAKKELEESLRLYTKLMGTQHPELARIKVNLGLSYQELGEFDKAHNLLKEALKINLELFGPKHPNTASTYNNLALVYMGEKDWKKAVELLKKSYEIFSELLGHDHPNTVAIFQTLKEAESKLQ